MTKISGWTTELPEHAGVLGGADWNSDAQPFDGAVGDKPGAAAIIIALEPPRQDDVLDLLAQADAYLHALYPPESNHILDIAALERAGIDFFVAREAGSALGCCALVPAPDGSAEIKRMFVAPHARGIKLGRRLLEHLEDQARRRGIATLRLETGIRQPEALGLYRASGYREIEPFGDYLPDPLSLFMAKPLAV